MSKAYKALSSYTDQGQFVMAMTADGKPQKQAVPLKVTLVRPNKVDIDTGIVQAHERWQNADDRGDPLEAVHGRSSTAERSASRRFAKGPIGAALVRRPKRRADVRSVESADRARTRGRDRTDRGLVAARRGQWPQTGGSQGGNTCAPDRSRQERTGVLLTIDPATKLLSSIDLKIAPEVAGRLRTFRSKNSAGRRARFQPRSPRIGRLRSRPPRASPRSTHCSSRRTKRTANNSKLGKPAPDFTLTLLDGPGKTKTITKAELAGKVVVIDFWATWCGPCLMELPEIQKLVESYANTKKEVIVVALSQDDEPAELAQLRKLVEKTLADKKINLTANPVGRIGLDPSKSVGTAFELEGYPTLVILGRQGDRPVRSRRLRPRSGRALQQDARQGDRYAAGRQVAREPQRSRPKRSRRSKRRRASDRRCIDRGA